MNFLIAVPIFDKLQTDGFLVLLVHNNIGVLK